MSKLDEGEMNHLLTITENVSRKGSQPIPPQQTGLLSKLRQIKIEAPEDFSTSLDAYMSGEKRIGDSSDIC